MMQVFFFLSICCNVWQGFYLLMVSHFVDTTAPQRTSHVPISRVTRQPVDQFYLEMRAARADSEHTLS